MPQQVNGRKREENCFRCWHCRRVDGLSSCCVCVANVSKSIKPEFIEEPYGGKCPQFFDKKIKEAEVSRFLGDNVLPGDGQEK